jgi:hypothetical protein
MFMSKPALPISTGEAFRNYVTHLCYFGVKAIIVEVRKPLMPLIIGRRQTPIARVSRYFILAGKCESKAPVISTTIGLLFETFTLTTSILR